MKTRMTAMAAAVLAAMLCAGPASSQISDADFASSLQGISVPSFQPQKQANPVVRNNTAPMTKMERTIQTVAGSVVKVSAGGSVGTGFVMLPDGVVATNAHVVGGAEAGTVVKVTLADGTEIPAMVLAAGDPEKLDVAFLRLPPNKAGWRSLPFMKTSQVRLGGEVLAIGHPFGLPQTVNRGIISGINRTEEYVTCLQTDAAINPGNSGGPLISIDGKVVGMNTKIFTPTGKGSVGIGFAISADDIVRAWNLYLKSDGLSPAWLGASLSLDEQGRLVVEQVFRGGPARKAGMMPDDLIVKMDGKAIEDPAEFLAQIHHLMPKDAITLTVLREGNEIEMKVVLEAQQPRRPQRIASIGFSTAS